MNNASGKLASLARGNDEYAAFNQRIVNSEKTSLTRQYLKYVDSWGQVDTTVVKLKTEQQKSEWWGFASECLKSPAEFTVRYGVIMLMTNFIKGDKLYKVLTTLQTVKHEGYYVKMAIAG